MCELVGLKVVGLKRVRIGRVALGDLPLGQWRHLREDERFRSARPGPGAAPPYPHTDFSVCFQRAVIS